MAVSEGKCAVVDYLLKQGAKVDAKDRWGKTPLDEVHENESVKEVLKKHGI